MMEYWNNGYGSLHHVEKYDDSLDHNAMDRKNINRGFKKAHPFVWECHDCHNGVVIPGTYKNIHGEIVTIGPNAPEAHKKS
jgi:hypothetical protein